MTDFVVEDVFHITGRGPVIARGRDVACRARDAGELFALGDIIHCGPLMATITGIERALVAGPTEAQGALLLRGVTKEQLIPGQIWSRVG